MIAKDALSKAIAVLTPTLGAEARNDASILLAHIMGVSRSGLLSAADDPLTADQTTRFGNMIAQRAKHQPVSQIIGSREFWGLEFIVTGDVLDPRADTETLVEAALAGSTPKRILDLGTGSGCILLSLLHECPTAIGTGVDISNAALDVARRNAQKLNLQDRVSFSLGDWFDELNGRYDLITSNPPYISANEMQALDADVFDWEPHIALTPGTDGLDSYRTIAKTAPKFLERDGRLLLEIGWKQADSVLAILRAENWKNLMVLKDLGGNDRVISANL